MSVTGRLMLRWHACGVDVSAQSWSNYLYACGKLLHQDKAFLEEAAPLIASSVVPKSILQASREVP